MEIPVVGFDPSMAGWGIAEGNLDLTSGFLTGLVLEVVDSKVPKNKQVRTNSIDLQRAEQLAARAFIAGRKAKVVFAEVPVGSQSADGMKAYGMVVGVLGSLRAEGIQVIEVTAAEVKKAFTNNKNATKAEMIAAGVALYPDANWPRYKENGQLLITQSKAEHMADAIAAIHAGVRTPVFQTLMRVFAGVL